MHIHIIGICGTFMGGLALLAKRLGMEVSGCDANVYPPMSTQLEAEGITLMQGFEPSHLDSKPDLIVVGNVMSRGNPLIEAVLEQGLNYTSGPAFLAEHILRGRWVLGVSGTHGKTTTSSMLAWILEFAGMKPGFLIGGIPQNFGVSARLGETPFFVIEADEYDTAFFDKRSKFVHYRPRTLVINNLEYDHADIFPDLAAIQTQFHHLMRMIPGNGLVVAPDRESNIDEVFAQGCWTPIERFAVDSSRNWKAELVRSDGSIFNVYFDNEFQGEVIWPLIGQHNVNNALAAMAAARHVGVPAAQAVEALATFQNVKRRMEVRGEVNQITVYDDFAHHPTAITSTLDGLRKQVGEQRIIAILEPRSNTMRLGVHQQQLAPALSKADQVILYRPAGLDWQIDTVTQALGEKGELFESTQQIIDKLCQTTKPGDHILIMSNGGFENIHGRLLEALEQKHRG